MSLAQRKLLYITLRKIKRLSVQSFYHIANALSIARSYNPDKLPHVHKITETI